MKKTTAKTKFKEALSYLKKTLPFIYFSIIIFAISAIIGFIFKDNLEFINQMLEELLAKTIGLNTLQITFFILQNNLQSAFFSVVLGLALGVFPFIGAVSNGAVLGYVLAKTAEVASFTIWWRLLPHGIFELPAIFIAFGVGIKMGSGFLTNYIKHYWKKSKAFIVLPILLAALSTIINFSLREQFLENAPLPISSAILLPASFLFSLFSYLALFIILTWITNKKLKRAQSKHLKDNFYNSMNVFLMIIIPLLIIAAIIEGLLIGLVG